MLVVWLFMALVHTKVIIFNMGIHGLQMIDPNDFVNPDSSFSMRLTHVT